MSTYTPQSLNPAQQPALNWKTVAIFAVINIVVALIPLLVAGTFDWWQAWLFAALTMLSSFGSRYLVFRKNPTLIAERARFTGAANIKSWDKWLVTTIAIIGPLVAYIVAGLDKRYGWSPEVSLGWVLVGTLLVVLGLVFVTWAMLVNAYFSSVVRIQTDRGQTVITTGPYRIIRHPGYSGGILALAGIPLLLGTLWAFIPVGIVIVLYIVRTRLEDRTLQRELAGYATYAQHTRYRLLPGVW
ncbi:MAG: isoprenylcysteine carboxylmethyltransferase family protein [Anaerolineae bacterium]|nr:isoprenylcysteine carboxylmethyltransferase family protein [Anaerolineae bacterium]